MSEKVFSSTPEDMKLFSGSFVALSATSFGGILRALTLPQWGTEFNLTSTQIGEIDNINIKPLALKTLLT
jgi:hypothetical protein